ncbi:MAG: hypothetical protein AAGH60_04135 [Pseudomonadota bacterium]
MTVTRDQLPPIALSVRQPWAWAIIHGGKVIENRSLGSIKSGKMDCRRIAIHAASGMTEKEYRWSYDKLRDHGVACPQPSDLIRSAIIGAVSVVDIVSESDSPWFGKSRPGNHGLVLENPVPCEPIAAKGELGYFAWKHAGEFALQAPWMAKYETALSEPGLFHALPLGFKGKPEKPFASASRKK